MAGVVLLVGAVTVAVIAITGGNAAKPTDAIVSIGPATITEADMDHQLRITGNLGGTRAAASGCSFTEASQTGQGRVSACENKPQQPWVEALRYLIGSRWLELAAAEGRLEIDDAAIDAQVRRQQRQLARADERDPVVRLVRRLGMKPEDMRRKLRFAKLLARLRRDMEGRIRPVSDAAVRRYYERYGRRYEQPEGRAIEAVVTKDRRSAAAAKIGLRRDIPLKRLVRRYATTATGQAWSGEMSVAEHSGDMALGHAVARVAPGDVGGPVKTQFGWYAFKVTSVDPRETMTLHEVAPTIRELLRERERQRLLRQFTDRYRPRTICAPGYRVPQCANGPEQLVDVRRR